MFAMTYIPLAEFQRNALRTSLKEETPTDLDEYSELQLRDLVMGRFPQEHHYIEDAWEIAEVATDCCFIAHTDFRLYSIPKDRRFAEVLLTTWRVLIDTDRFPCSAEIRAGICPDYPPLIVREREDGKFYVLDGQRRIITLLYHSVPLVKVHLYIGSRQV